MCSFPVKYLEIIAQRESHTIAKTVDIANQLIEAVKELFVSSGILKTVFNLGT